MLLKATLSSCEMSIDSFIRVAPLASIGNGTETGHKPVWCGSRIHWYRAEKSVVDNRIAPLGDRVVISGYGEGVGVERLSSGDAVSRKSAWRAYRE